MSIMAVLLLLVIIDVLILFLSHVICRFYCCRAARLHIDAVRSVRGYLLFNSWIH